MRWFCGWFRSHWRRFSSRFGYDVRFLCNTAARGSLGQLLLSFPLLQPGRLVVVTGGRATTVWTGSVCHRWLRRSGRWSSSSRLCRGFFVLDLSFDPGRRAPLSTFLPRFLWWRWDFCLAELVSPRRHVSVIVVFLLANLGLQIHNGRSAPCPLSGPLHNLRYVYSSSASSCFGFDSWWWLSRLSGFHCRRFGLFYRFLEVVAGLISSERCCHGASRDGRNVGWR